MAGRAARHHENTMKTREQFENPSHERFPLGVFGQTDLGADAFNLDLDLDVVSYT